eukprot:4449723-Prymnesium_polylepis.1
MAEVQPWRALARACALHVPSRPGSILGPSRCRRRSSRSPPSTARGAKSTCSWRPRLRRARARSRTVTRTTTRTA